ncbi:MAG: DMT family transporter [Anaerolineae bacterium]
MNRAYPVLALGVVAVSFAAILIRWAEAPALVVAAYRLGIASAIVLPLAGMRSRAEWALLPVRAWLLLAASGVFLGLHFALWIASLSHTSVASSVIFVTTSPLFVAAAAHLLGIDRVSRPTAIGIAVAAAGGILIGSGDLSVGRGALWGDLLALGGAAMAAGYLLIGRKRRRGLTNLAYVAPVYGLAALLNLGLAAGAGLPFGGYAAVTFLMFLFLALGPQLLGHSSINWALGHLSAPFVSVAILGEPVGATLLAYLLLSETPAPETLAGGALILAGVYLASRGERVRSLR